MEIMGQRSQNDVPSEVPTTVAPTLQTFTCAPYALSYSYSNTQDFVLCSFFACGGGDPITISGCGCSGYQILSLYSYSSGYISSGNQECGTCDSFSFTPPGSSSDCQEYAIRQGCYYYYYCSGTTTVTGNVVALPTEEPTSVPPSETPSEVPSQAPTYSQAPTGAPFLCPDYTSVYTQSNTVGYSQCVFSACGGATLTISGCFACTGIQLLSLYDETNSGLLTTSSHICGPCGGFQYTVPGGAEDCSVYYIREGCETSYCTGTVFVSGAQGIVLPSSMPTSVPSLATPDPSLMPTDAPVVNSLTRPPPMVYSVVVPVVIVSAVLFTSMFVYFCRSGSSSVTPGRNSMAYEGVELL